MANTEYLKMSQIIRLLNVSKKTAYKMLSSGKLKYSRPTPHTIRIKRSDLECFLEKSTETNEE